MALGPQSPAVAPRRRRQHGNAPAVGACTPGGVPAHGDQGDAHTSPEPVAVSRVVTLDLETSAAHERRFEPRTVEFPGVGRIVPTGAGQADEILVGIEVWHWRGHPTDEKVRASLWRRTRQAPLEALLHLCVGPLSLPDLGLRNKFVTLAAGGWPILRGMLSHSYREGSSTSSDRGEPFRGRLLAVFPILPRSACTPP